jgi:hypothetical protein
MTDIGKPEDVSTTFELLFGGQKDDVFKTIKPKQFKELKIQMKLMKLEEIR